MRFVFYDTETTGTETTYDQILQFAAILTDDELREVETVNLRCRRLPHVVPSPGALLATRIPVADLDGVNLSHYEMARQLYETLLRWSPAAFLGFNSLGFDETLLRQAFYGSLLPVYLTNTGGNCRADVLRMVQAAEVYAPGSVAIPMDRRGRRVFRLIDLARANGVELSEETAHDALNDTRATLELARVVQRNAPRVWARMMANARKDDVLGFVEEHEVFCVTTFYYGNPYSHVVTLAGRNPEYDSELAVFDLAHRPEDYVDLTAEQLVAVLARSPKVIRTLRANAQPIVMPFAMAPDTIRGPRFDEVEYRARARAIRTNAAFRTRLEEALPLRYPATAPSPYVEARIYDGFPEPEDERLMRDFHAMDWGGRAAAAARFRDDRYREIARRLIYVESPGTLSEAERAILDRWIADRLLSEADVPWTTIPKALREVESLRSSGGDADRLQEIEAYLLRLADRHRPG